METGGERVLRASWSASTKVGVMKLPAAPESNRAKKEKHLSPERTVTGIRKGLEANEDGETLTLWVLVGCGRLTLG